MWDEEKPFVMHDTGFSRVFLAWPQFIDVTSIELGQTDEEETVNKSIFQTIF